MGTIVDREARVNYMKYVKQHLRAHPEFFQGRVVASFHELVMEPVKIKKFLSTKNDSVYKNVRAAICIPGRAPGDETLAVIYNNFKIPLSYELFVKENFALSLFAKVPKNIQKSANADKLYNGHPPDWEDIAAGFDFRRTLYTSSGGIRDKIFGLLNRMEGIRFYFLTGVAGTGKSCILKRLAYDLSQTYKDVYYFSTDSDSHKDVREIYDEVCALVENAHKSVVFLLDGCYKLIKPKDYLQITKIISQYYKKPILFVIAENNTNYHNLINDNNFVPGYLHEVLQLKLLDDSEIEQIFSKIKTLENDKKLTKIKRHLNISELIELCKTKYAKHLLVVFLQIRLGKRFPDIIKDECKNLKAIDESGFTIIAYIIICLFSKLGVDTHAQLLFHYLGKPKWKGEEDIERNCSGIVIYSGRYYRPRHSIIGAEVFNIYLKAKNNKVFDILNEFLDVNTQKLENSVADFVNEILAIKNIHLRLFELANEEENIVREFYENLANFPMTQGNLLRKYYTSYGLFEKQFLHYERAISIFKQIGDIRNNSFILRMISYCHLSLKNFKESGKFAIKAYHCTQKEEPLLNIAILLRLNRNEYFLKAEEIFNRLSNSHDENIKKECLKYFQHLENIKALKISSNEEVNNFIISKIRPGLMHSNLHINSSTAAPRIELFELLINQQDYFIADINELKHVKVLFDRLDDANLKGLFYRMYAKSIETKLRQMEDVERNTEIDKLYCKSIELNEHDSFTHFFYAEFLKDFKNDFVGAEREYRRAIEVGDQSRHSEYKRHPKFLNGLATLYLELLDRDLELTAEQLTKTRELLCEAIEQVNIRHMDFTLPMDNLRIFDRYK